MADLRDDLLEVRKHIRRKYESYACYAGLPEWKREWLEQVVADEAILDRAIAMLQPSNQRTWVNS
jgi:hypothetical protein